MEQNKLKIVIINYRYFISGGPERYLFNIKDLLESHGHTIIPFSVKNINNHPTEYDKYFLDPIGAGNEVYFSQYSKFNPKVIYQTFGRMFYSFTARRKLSKLIVDTKPDLIYVLQYQNKLSISIFDAAIKHKVPIVHRISDFGQICSNAMFFRPIQKDLCERCLVGPKIHAITNKCVHDSYMYSFLKASSLQLQQFWGVAKKINTFVIPSKFTLQKLKEYGFPENKLVNIPTFFNFRSISNPTIKYEPYALYIGRIEENKGLWTLIKAFEGTDYNLKIIGFSPSKLDVDIMGYLKDKKHNIEFLGKKDFKEIEAYLATCAYTVVPSEWYDNFPNTVLESFAYKKAVIATDLGSLKETVINNETGLLFQLKNVQDLKSKISLMLNDLALCRVLGENAFAKLNAEFSEENHYSKLISLFYDTISPTTKY